MRSLLPQRLALGVGIGVWSVAVIGGMAALWSYGARPGAAAAPPPHWPIASTLDRAPGRATLLVFAHPHCPCTRASLEEIDRLLASAAERPDVRVLFTKPPDTAPDWDATDLWRRAAAIPGIMVARDDEGREAERFGVTTSGQLLLYDAAGALRFAGGITPSRGHGGDSVGRSVLLELLAGAPAEDEATPVFGCALAEAAS
jgi:hypothetical protein